MRGNGFLVAAAIVSMIAGCGRRDDGARSGGTAVDTASAPPAEHVPEGRAPAGNKPPTLHLSAIVPGESLGAIRIGERIDSVDLIFGRADSSDAAMGHVWEFRTFSDTAGGFKDGKYELDVYGVRDDAANQVVVKQIRATAPRYRTASGLSTESTLADIRKVYPGARALAFYNATMHDGRIDLVDLPAEGIAFEVQHSDADPVAATCIAIIVHPRGAEVTHEYLQRHQYQQVK